MKQTLSKRRQKWCAEYEQVTTFEPLMDDFYEGNETFQEAAEHSVQWFADWVNEVGRAMPRIPR
jgi:hypothetical protein